MKDTPPAWTLFFLLSCAAVLAVVPVKASGQRAVPTTESAIIAATAKSTPVALSNWASRYGPGDSDLFPLRLQLETRADTIAAYALAGALIGGVAGYVVFRRGGKPCGDYEYVFCGAVLYTVGGMAIGMPFGALVGYLRTRPKPHVRHMPID